MEISIDNINGLQVLSVIEPRIDAAAAIQFKDKMKELTGQHSDNVVLNLENVQFIDSSGLGAIVAAKKHMGNDRQLLLAGLTPIVAKVFSLTRMEKVFKIHANVSDAVDDGDKKSA